MWNLISREPVASAAVVQAIFAALAVFLPASVPPEARGALLALGTALAVWVRSAVTPNAKL